MHGYNFTTVIMTTQNTCYISIALSWVVVFPVLHTSCGLTLITCNHVTVSFKYLAAAEKFNLAKRKVMQSCLGQWECIWLHFLLLEAFK